MSSKKSVLVFRTGHLGDTICAVPAFRLLRQYFGEDKLFLLCDQSYQGKVAADAVCASLGVFDGIFTYRSELGIVTAYEMMRRILSIRPDEIVILPQIRESVQNLERKKLLFRLCGVKTIRGSCTPTASQVWHPNEPTRLIKMLNEVGIPGEKPPYGISVNLTAKKAVIEMLSQIGINPNLPFIFFCGGGKVSTQRWPLARYGAVLQAITKELSWPVVAIGNASEVVQYRGEVSEVFPSLYYLEQMLSLSELFELCRLATVYLGNDTGPMHLAAAVGCPVAVVMSARNAPGLWDPDVEPRLIIRHRTECEDCFLNDCVKEKHRCMTQITVEQVIAQVIPFIQSLTLK